MRISVNKNGDRIRALVEHFQRFGAVFGFENGKAGAAQKLRDGVADQGLVVDDENGGVCHAHLNAWSRDLKRRFRRYA
jgi:hypothetical protein